MYRFDINKQCFKIQKALKWIVLFSSSIFWSIGLDFKVTDRSSFSFSVLLSYL